MCPAAEEEAGVEDGLGHYGGRGGGDRQRRRGARDEGPRVIPAPRAPTQKEIDAHMATHLPHADWCEICMKGRGRNAPHRRRKRRAPVKGEASGDAGTGLGPASSEGEPEEADPNEGIVPKVSMD